MTDSLTAHRRRVPGCVSLSPQRLRRLSSRPRCPRCARPARSERRRPARRGRPGRLPTPRTRSRSSRSSTSTARRSAWPALTIDASLSDSAVWKARHMAAYGYFAHNDPAPPIARDPFTRMLNCGYAAGGALGENIAAGQQTPSDVMTAWLNSPGHRANIEDPSFRSTGVGVAVGGPYGIYWVQDFASGGGSGAPPPSPPPPPAAAAPAAAAAPGSPPPPPPTSAAAACAAQAAGAAADPPAGSAACRRLRSAAPPAAARSGSRGRCATTAVGERGHGRQQGGGDRRARTELRRTRLEVAKPHAGKTYVVRMSFGRVPVATSAPRRALPRASSRASSLQGQRARSPATSRPARGRSRPTRAESSSRSRSRSAAGTASRSCATPG